MNVTNQIKGERKMNVFEFLALLICVGALIGVLFYLISHEHKLYKQRTKALESIAFELKRFRIDNSI